MPTNRQITTSADLTAHFRAFLRIMNTRLWSNLGTFIAPRVSLNGRRFSPQGFARLAGAGSVFTAHMVVADAGKRTLAVRLDIEIPSPSGTSSRVTHDHVFYHFDDEWRVDEAWSVQWAAKRERESAEPCPCAPYVSHELHTPAPATLSAKPRRPLAGSHFRDAYPELPVPVQLVTRRQSVGTPCEVSTGVIS